MSSNAVENRARQFDAQAVRKQVIDKAIAGRMVAELAARTAVAQSRIATATAGGKRWQQAVALSETIVALASIEHGIATGPPNRRGYYIEISEQVSSLMVNAWTALRDSLEAREFGGFSSDPLKLANAVLAANRSAKPQAKRSSGKVEDRVWDFDSLLNKPTPKAKKPTAKQRKNMRSFIVPLALRVVKAKSAGDQPHVIATASSTAVDLEGDTFSVAALKGMRKFFNDGALIFMNHDYTIPGSVFGASEKAVLVKRGDRTDLDLVIRVEQNNPLAMQTYAYVKDGATLGVSVGVIIDEAEKREEGGLNILATTPLEASVVGIPANQTAWTQAAS